MKIPVVKILVSCPKPEWIDACTWVFKTLRVGFPTARIDVTLNDNVRSLPGGIYQELLTRCTVDGKSPHVATKWELHHADWIRECVESHDSDAPLVILDADTYFWSSVEHWDITALLAGYYVPMIWNDFAKCPSAPRIHTSFMWFGNVPELRRVLKEVYPPGYDSTAAYSPVDPYMPAVMFGSGKPFFWDSCANLYAMLGNSHSVYHFGEKEKACFEHLNSASFFDVMKERSPGRCELRAPPPGTVAQAGRAARPAVVHHGFLLCHESSRSVDETMKYHRDPEFAIDVGGPPPRDPLFNWSVILVSLCMAAWAIKIVFFS